MSVFKYIFDSNWSQRSDIEALKERSDALAERISRKRYSDSEQEARLEDLEQEIGELALICKTLMQILLEKRVCTGQEIEAMLKQIDLADGVADGKVTKESAEELKECPNCGRPVQHHHTHCVYCGREY